MTRMPVVFFGHGNPLNALARNEWTEAWAATGRAMAKPKAVLCISAHWYLPVAPSVTAGVAPRTIHDFGGFPRELYEVEYRAPGAPELAERLHALVGAEPSDEWGLDHGTWSVLCHVFPEADVPIVQLSLDESQPPRFHYELGRKLAPLREEGVLIAGSGNLVHNLHTYAWGRHPVEPFDWALRFEVRARELLTSREHGPLIDYESMGEDARLAIPTPEHYLPLLYIMALQRDDEEVSFPVQGVDGGSVSMLSVAFGL